MAIVSDTKKYWDYGGASGPIYVDHIYLKSTGIIRTDPDSWTTAEIADAGITGPYTKPDYDDSTHYLVWNAGTKEWDITANPVTITPDSELWFNLRQQRNGLIADTDGWLDASDSSFSASEKNDITTYRAELRNLTTGISSITDWWAANGGEGQFPTAPNVVKIFFGISTT